MQANNFPPSEPSDPFLRLATDPKCTQSKTYSKRLEEARKNYKDEPLVESQRALYVFGLHDGMTPWLLDIVGKGGSTADADCITTANFVAFKDSTSDEHKMLHRIAQKIGIIPGEVNQGCLWNPGKGNPHKVPTLVLKGGADGVTAGCQAETFFNEGLARGNRIFILFPSMGHILRGENIRMQKFGGELSDLTEWGNAFKNLTEQFLASTMDDYLTKIEVTNGLATLKAEKRPITGETVPCPAL